MSSPEAGDSTTPQRAHDDDPGSAEDHVITFDIALEALRQRILRLTCTIIARDYLAAWSAKQDVVRSIERIKHYVAKIPEGPVQDDAKHRLSSVITVADQMIACAPAPSDAAIRQARSTNWRADRSIWKREEQEWIASHSASIDSTINARCPEAWPDIPRSSDAGASGFLRVLNEVRDPPPSPPATPFDPAEALQNLHGQVIQLEAMTNAASEAVTQLPFPSEREDRRIFDRVYTLVTKVADETNAVMRYGDELVSALAAHLKTRRTGADGAPVKRS